VFCLFPTSSAWAQVITTVAGTNWLFPTGSLSAVNAPLGHIQSVAVDANGNLYIADIDGNTVTQVTPGGVLTVVAGNGSAGYSGDNGPAVSARLNQPNGVAVDTAGNLYIADTNNQRIRKVTPAGVISTLAGSGSAGYSGDNGPATSAKIWKPMGVAVDGSGNLYIADAGNNRIRMVTPVGTISTLAGTGSANYSGDGGPAISATLHSPGAVAVDGNGNLYIADTTNNRIRKVTPNGTINTVVGDGSSAELYQPQGVAVDSAGDLYIADTQHKQIREVTPGGKNIILAGSGTLGFSGDGGPAGKATLDWPFGVAVDASGDYYIADTNNFRVRKVTPNGVINTVAGNGAYRFSGDGGPATSAALNSPAGIAFDSAGNAYVADSAGNRVRKITPAGIITTVAGNGSYGYSGDGGPATSAELDTPSGVAVDAKGNLYIADTKNNHIRRVTPDGTISTFATSLPVGKGLVELLNLPAGVAVDAAGNLYISDTSDNQIRKVDTNGVVSIVAGNGKPAFAGDGGLATAASLNAPGGVAVDTAGNLYIADTGNSRVRKVDTNGVIGTLVPTNPAYLPSGVTVDAAGNLYVANTNGQDALKVGANGVTSTLAGNGNQAFAGDGGLATGAGLNQPKGVAIDPSGNLYIADTGNGRVREVIEASAVSFKVSSSLLTFSAIAGGAPPPAQSINVTSSIPGVAFTASYTAQYPWLKVTPTSGFLPVTLQVSADPSNLTAGNYDGGVITISVPVATPPTATVSGHFTVQSSTPILKVTSPGLTFGITQGSPAQTQTIQVQNAGTGTSTLTFSAAPAATSGGNWLSVSPATGSATPTSPGLLQVTATPGSLAPGVYQGTVKITSDYGNATVNVTLNITQGPQLQITQSGLSFTAAAGGSSPPPQSFTILNAGQGSLGWSASATTLSGGNWLLISPSAGTVDQTTPNGSQLMVSIDATVLSSLDPGAYQGNIQISANAAGSQSSAVTLTVLDPASIPPAGVYPAGLVFTSVAGSVSPGEGDVKLSNPGTTTDNYFTSHSGTGFNFQPSTATLPATLRVFPGGLSSGVNNGVINLQFADGTQSSVRVLTVAPGPGCSTGILEVVFRSPSSAQSFTVTAGQSVTVEVEVVDDCGNLISSTNGQNPTVTAGFSNGDSDLTLSSIGNGIWQQTWTPMNPSSGPVTITVFATNNGIAQTGKFPPSAAQ
jgi:sugar lactone lactonase YvrE